MINQVILPYGYVKLEYVMNTQLQPLINTGVLADNNLGVYIDYELVDKGNNNTFGAISSNSGYKRHHFMVNGNIVYYYYNTKSYNLGSADLLRHKLLVDPTNHVIQFDFTQKTLDTETFNPQLNYGLFGRTYTNSSLQYSFKAKIYECKLFTSGNLVRWFIPCKNSSDVCGLFDICTKTFYGPNDDTILLQNGPKSAVNDVNNCYIRGKSVCRVMCNNNVLWGLPSNYTKLPYITNPSTAYINTGIEPNSNLRIDLKFSINNAQSNTQTYPIFGGRTATTTDVFAGWYQISTNTITGHYGNRGHTAGGGAITLQEGVQLNTIYSFSMNKNELTVNQYHSTMTEYTFTSDKTIYLFAIHSGNGIDNRRLRGSIYMCQLWNNNVLVRNYIPCKDENNVCGFYDLVSRTFYSSASDVNFTYSES